MKYIDKYIKEISSMLENHFSKKVNIEKKYKKIKENNNKKSNKN